MHTIKICLGGTCLNNFSVDTLKRAETVLGIHAGESTADGKFKLGTCGCLSNCEQGPNVYFGTQDSPLSALMGGTIENHMRPNAIEAKIKSLQNS